MMAILTSRDKSEWQPDARRPATADGIRPILASLEDVLDLAKEYDDNAERGLHPDPARVELAPPN